MESPTQANLMIRTHRLINRVVGKCELIKFLLFEIRNNI